MKDMIIASLKDTNPTEEQIAALSASVIIFMNGKVQVSYVMPKIDEAKKIGKMFETTKEKIEDMTSKEVKEIIVSHYNERSKDE